MTAPKPERVQKLCTLRTHTSNDDVIFDLGWFPELGLRPGDLAQIVAVREGTAVRDFQKRVLNIQKHGNSARRPGTEESTGSFSTWRESDSTVITFDENGNKVSAGKEGDLQRSYVFQVQELTPEQRQKSQGAQLSISSTIATVFGFRNWMQVLVSTADEDLHSASHVEITFRDQYLSRADMWRLAISELSQKTIYKDQKLLFLETIKATVKNVYIDGQRKKSGYFSATTKPIFRSESARFILFIQMSREMWEFDAEGGGEIMFNNVINGFLPELFKNWMAIQARHLVSIILFSRVEYEDESDHRHFADLGDRNSGSAKPGSRDFYRVVVSDMASNDWVRILYQLKKEFRTFLRDITVQRSAVSGERSNSTENDSFPDYVIVGKPSTAAKGNILEAINMASSQFSRDYIDRDLVRTGISVVVITAGTGVYEVDYSLLKLTTDTLISSGIGIDLVCLSPMPLHSVPLFKYRNPRLVGSDSPMVTTTHSSVDNTPRQNDLASMLSRANYQASRKSIVLPDSAPIPGEWSYAIPHWIDVSFWNGTADEQAMLLRSRPARESRTHSDRRKAKPFSLRCVLYELEMMGFMENEMTNICVSLLHESPFHPWHKLRHRITGRAPTEVVRTEVSKLDREWMDEYDENLFRPAYQREIAEEAARKKSSVFQPESGSYVETVKVVADSNNRQSTGYLDWKMRDRPTSKNSRAPVQRKASVLSFGSAADSTASKTSKFSRQISFGASGLAAPMEDFSSIVGDVRPATLSREVTEDLSPEPASSNFFQQFKAALTRSALGKETSNTPKPTPKRANASRPSKPIDIGASRAATKHSRSSSDDQVGSVETVKGNKERQDNSSLPKHIRAEDSGAILFAASSTRRIGPKPGLSSSGDAPPIPQTLSPVSALAPWLVLVNPSNPRKNNFNLNSQFRRWQHVFPKQLRIASMKWKSLSSPASVPLTNDYFPTAEQLANEYQESPYKISQNTDDEFVEVPRTREALVRELIAFRLAHGFQLVVGPAVADFLGSHGSDLVNIFDKKYMAKDGATVFMTVGNSIHQLLCLDGGELEIRRFNRKPTAEIESAEGSDRLSYRPYIRTALDAGYQPRDISFRQPQIEYNWNFIDTFIAGYDNEFSDNLRFWRARFVFIPVDIPSHGHRPLSTLTEDSPEEIRLEGIRKLTQIWQRHRVLPVEERTFQSTRWRKDPNPLMIEYQTRDPSVIIAAGLEGSLLTDGDVAPPPTMLFSETDTYSTKNIDLQKLAHELQGDKGIRMLDRRWHWKVYSNCFIGFDLTNWILERFRDIETREDGVTFGNELMEQGLFQHVQKKHQFRDGNFFYQLAPEYRAPRPDSRAGWFSTVRREKSSVPSTPSLELTKPQILDHSRSRPNTSSSSEQSEDRASTASEVPRRKVTLSHAMRYNVDIRKQSYRPEYINLHYDRLHSPDNCYHFRIDWMNVTAKFIEDSILHWAMNARKYGLKLVELPIAEADIITGVHPFRSPYIVKLAVAPPQKSALAEYLDSTSFASLAQSDRFAFHKAILKKLNFVLDVESKSSFPSDVEVVYSWGKNDYRFTQYIHRSGTTLAQITDVGDFLLLANRLHNDRWSAVRDGARFEKKDSSHERRGNNRQFNSPMSSPIARPAAEEPPTSTQPSNLTAEDIKDEIEAFCHDESALRAFYDELTKPEPSPSSHVSPASDQLVPVLRLPPKLTSDEESSYSPTSSTTGKS